MVELHYLFFKIISTIFLVSKFFQIFTVLYVLQDFYKDFMKLCQSYKVIEGPRTPDKQDEKVAKDNDKQKKTPPRPG